MQSIASLPATKSYTLDFSKARKQRQSCAQCVLKLQRLFEVWKSFCHLDVNVTTHMTLKVAQVRRKSNRQEISI